MKMNNETNINNINYIRYMENEDDKTEQHTKKEQTTTERK